MVAYGIPESDVARVLSIDAKTLRKHYRDELDLGATKANAQVAGFLFNAAKSGNVSAQIFWLKTRARWKEAPHDLHHSGAIGSYDLHELTDEDLERIVRSSPIELPVRPMRQMPAPRRPAEPAPISPAAGHSDSHTR